MKIGLFGGTFNPIHNGHVALAERLLRAARLDEVWLLVTPQNPWKAQMELLDDDLRLLMASAGLEGKPHIKASDYEFHLPRPSYTWDTLQALSKDFPDHRFALLIGGDNWAKFGQWRAHDQILAHHDVVVYPRKGYAIDRSQLPERVHIVQTRLIDISSTDIRQRIAQGLPFEHLVPPRVAEIIHERGLYAHTPPKK